MRLVGRATMREELTQSHRWWLRFQRDISGAGGSFWEAWGLNTSLGSQYQSIGTHITSDCDQQQSFYPPGKDGRDSGTLLKAQSTEFILLPLPLSSGEGKVEQTRIEWGESGVCGSGEEAEGATARIPVLIHSPIPESPSFLGGVLPPTASAWGKTIAPLSGFTLTSPCGAYTLLKSGTRCSFNDWA